MEEEDDGKVQSDALAGARDHASKRSERRAELFLPVSNHVADINLPGYDKDDQDENGPKLVDEIESLCMNCQENGTTRLLLTKIPYFREIVLMSFYCEHCYFKNTEIQSAGEIQEQGAKYTLKMDCEADNERQVVKSDTAIVRIEDLDIEIPAGRGKLTNVEGMLKEILDDLEKDQKRRKTEHPDLYKRLEDVVQELSKLSAKPNLTITVDDPAGNSWIEPSPVDKGSKYTRIEYPRSPQQNASLGLISDDTDGEAKEDNDQTETSARDIAAHEAIDSHDPTQPTSNVLTQDVDDSTLEGVDILNGELYSMPCHCPGCAKFAMMNLQTVNVPHFKQVIISAVVCTHCGYRTNDVKSGSEVPQKGQRIHFSVEGPADLRRDILKSETCMLKIPACRVEVVPGTMGGRFTTVEGLLTQIRDDLHGSIFDADDIKGTGGDSMPLEAKKAWDDFFAVLDKAIRGEMKYEILLEDPLANSYVQNNTAPEPDPQIRIEEYERTEEDEEELGLTDMKTERGTNGIYVKESVGEDSQAETKVLKEEEEEEVEEQRVCTQDGQTLTADELIAQLRGSTLLSTDELSEEAD